MIPAAQEPVLTEQAMKFQSLMEREAGEPRDDRRAVIAREIRRRGSYWHSIEELEKGTWLAWLHSMNCPGRQPNDLLQVHDGRYGLTPLAEDYLLESSPT